MAYVSGTVCKPQEVWKAYHMLLIIAHHLPFFDLLRLRYGPHPGPSVVAQVLRERVDLSFSPFLLRRVTEFFYHLKDCRGIVMGSVVNEVLLSQSDCRDGDDGVNSELDEAGEPKTVTNIYRSSHVSEGNRRPSTMLVVIEGNSAAMKGFLQSLGYQQAEMDEEAYEDSTAFIREPSEVLRGQVEAFELMTPSVTYTVLILASRYSALNVLLCAESTGEMNCISFDAFLSYYPRLIARREGLFVGPNVDPQTRPLLFITEEALNIFSDNRHWKKPCGAYCPAAWRQTLDDEGAMRVPWFPGPRPLSMQPQARQGGAAEKEEEGRRGLYNIDSLTWRISDRCINPSCDLGRRYEELSQYIDM